MKLPLLSLALLLGASACSFESNDPPADTDPDGPVATHAAEAWPSAPSGVPVISAPQILSACNRAGECSPEVTSASPTVRTALVDLCVHDAVFSAERAIPLSGFNLANERAEFWVTCVLGAVDCAAVAACKTERDTRIDCQEDGCRASEKLGVTCQGSVATLTGQSGTSQRDCARAYAMCDPKSATGCTDRHFSACAADDAPGDRCDGAIRLGCDGAGQVSYHDCSRVGGSCGLEPDGTEGCIYPTSGACSLAKSDSSSCAAGTLRACVLGQALEMQSALCYE